MNYVYTLYNITMAVPFPCPMLTPATVSSVPDVSVVEGPVPYSLLAPVVEGSNWQASPGQFLFRGGRFSGRFLVESGRRITLQRNPSAKDAKICAHLLASVVAALLRQRNHLVLHANVAVTPAGAVAITGNTGSGKSTAQAALLARGCRMLTDDITVIGITHDGRVIALPGVPKLNLCEDAAVKLGHDVTSLPRNPLRNAKVFVPVRPGDTMSESLPLKTIYYLDTHTGEGLNVTQLSGTEKFAALQECIYGPLFPDEHHGLFALVTSLINQVDFVRVERPASRWSVNEVAEAILNG